MTEVWAVLERARREPWGVGYVTTAGDTVDDAAATLAVNHVAALREVLRPYVDYCNDCDGTGKIYSAVTRDMTLSCGRCLDARAALRALDEAINGGKS